MDKPHHLLQAAIVVTFMISTSPVWADHCDQAADNAQEQHHRQSKVGNKQPCTHQQSQQKTSPNTATVQLSLEANQPSFSSQPLQVTQ